MRWLGQILLVLLAGGASLSQAPTAAVSGRVFKYETREPLGDITVELIREGGAPAVAQPPGLAQLPAAIQQQQLAAASARIVVNTASDGSFALRDLTPGNYRIYGTAPNGYLPAEYGQRSPTGLGMPVTLKADQEIDGITLTMTPTASISGRVTDAAGEPVVYANVIAGRVVYRDGVRTLEAAQSSMTNDRGEYRIFWLAPGSYVLDAIPLEMRQYSMPPTPPARFGGREHISQPLIALRPSPDGGPPIEVTYMPAYFPGVADLRSTRRITVRPGESIRADINAAASEVPSLRVRGVVIGDVGGRGASARITLVPRFVEGHSVQPPAGNTDNTGAFDIHGVVPGSYLLFAGTTVLPIEVSDKGLDNVRVQLVAPVTIPWQVSVENPEVTVPDVSVSLTREPRLAGAPGTPVAGAGVGGAPRGQQVVKALQNVGNGDYRVNVNGLPVGMYVKAIRLGGDDVLRDGLRVYGSISNTLEIILSASAGTVEGVVVDDQRRPFTNATIALVPSLGLRQSRLDLFKTTHSGTDGRFRIVSVPPGEYKLFAWEEIQTGDWYNPDFMQNEELRGVTVRVTERNTESHVLPVIPMDGSAR